MSNKRLKLVLGGGGSFGLCHIGAIQYIVEHSYDIDLIVGTSAGAIVAGLYSYYLNNGCEYALSKLNELVNINFDDFKDSNYFKRIYSLLTNNIYDFGLYKGDKLYNFVLKQTNSSTFADVSMPLYITATEMTTGSAVIFSKDTSPYVKLADAIRASSSIQGIYTPFKIKCELIENAVFPDNNILSRPMTLYELKNISKDGYIYLWDGGNCGNCRNDIALSIGDQNVPVFGHSLSYSNNYKDLTLLDLLPQTISIMMSTNERITDALSSLRDTKDVICHPDTSGLDSMEFKLTKEEKMRLIHSGYVAAKYNLPSIM